MSCFGQFVDRRMLKVKDGDAKIEARVTSGCTGKFCRMGAFLNSCVLTSKKLDWDRCFQQ